MNGNKLPHNWHDTDAYPTFEDKIPASAWVSVALVVAVFFLAFFMA